MERQMERQMFSCRNVKSGEINSMLDFVIRDNQAPTDSVGMSLSIISFPTSISDRLPRKWLTVNMTVNYLSLYELNIRSIQEGAFNSDHFTELESLSIKNTPIGILYENSFLGLMNLKEIFLTHLELHTIQANVFAPMLNLQKVLFEHCGDHIVSLDNFFGGTVQMFHLNVVEISKCNLNDTITSSTFSSLRNVTELLLHENQITEIGPHSFDIILATATRKLIDLRVNKLKTLPRNIFRHSQGEAIIDLDKNPWHCDCDIEPLRRFINDKTNNVKLSLIKCLSPPNKAFRFLNKLGPICKYTPFEDETYPLYSHPFGAETLHVSSNYHLSPWLNLQQQTSNVELTLNSSAVSKGHFGIKCFNTTFYHPFNKFRSRHEAILTKFDRNRRLTVRNENGQLIVDVEFDNYDSSFVVFELNSLDNSSLSDVKLQSGNKDNFKKSAKCFVKNVERKPSLLKTKLGMTLKPNHMYRFCWIKRLFTSNFPSDCLTFYSEAKNEPLSNDTWILMEMNKMIIFAISSAILACAAGIWIVILLANAEDAVKCFIK
ncbi:uncharacterized protein LOC129570597 [Sitodiplosis mosellana]|uniref:uncharacterized protein LOC129570597 n=1 Tax=Sitodiplosis mosellana TaxID=263140 RepID=UPI0024453004|nr:uncharacterized protein LOC129570597 [Sitodiplosis mosellana]